MNGSEVVESRELNVCSSGFQGGNSLMKACYVFASRHHECWMFDSANCDESSNSDKRSVFRHRLNLEDTECWLLEAVTGRLYRQMHTAWHPFHGPEYWLFGL